VIARAAAPEPGVKKPPGTLAAKVPFTGPVLAALLRRHWKLKLWLLVLVPLGLSIPFRALEAWPLFPVRIYPQIWLDRMIPFLPSAAWFYLSCFVYAATAGLLVANRRECWRFCWIMVGMGLIANAVFLIHPTAVPPRPVVPDQPYAFVVGHDGPGNGCPSLHVAFSVFAAFVAHDWLSRFRARRSLRLLSWAWALAVSLSTIAIRQHLAIDFLWGALLGLAGGIAWHWEDLRRKTGG
jgi:membrane-associated phospholipid phosphatase